MNNSNFRFTLDLQSTQSQVCIPVTRGDTARTWHISFSDGILPYQIADGCLAMLEIERPTGTHLEAFCPIENGTTVIYDFLQNTNTAAVEGIHDCAIVLFDESGDVIASPRFTMVVSNRVINSDDIDVSDEEYTVIDGIISAEASRQSAEKVRVNSESQRVQDEKARNTAETERSTSEAKRNENFAALSNSINRAAAALVSPTVTVKAVTGGNKVTVTDKNGAKDFTVMNGKDGANGTQGPQGIQGLQGPSGKDGKPFAIEKTYASVNAMNSGFASDGVTEGGFVVITSGVDDEDNAKLFLKGKSGYIFITDLSGAQGMQGPQGVQGKQGVQGLQGIQGPQGNPGAAGANGKSAYQYAKEMGYTGTEEAFANDINPNTIKALATPKKGVDYTDGYTPVKGVDYFDGASIAVSSVNESTASGGSNVVTFSDGKTLTVKNGIDGKNGSDYIITDDDKNEITDLVIAAMGGQPVFGYVDGNNNIIITAALDDNATYRVKYEMDDGGQIDIGDIKFHQKITNTLSNCFNSNTAVSVGKGDSYYSAIYANSGYEMSTITVTMGGVDITSTAVSGDNINIETVTGDIVITAVATVIKPRTNFFKATPTVNTNSTAPQDAMVLGGRFGSDLGYRADNGPDTLMTNYIQIQNGDELVFTNMTLANSYSGLCSNIGDTKAVAVFNPSTDNGVVTNIVENGFKIVTDSANYVRICGRPTANIKINASASVTNERYDCSQIIINVKRNGEWL